MKFIDHSRRRGFGHDHLKFAFTSRCFEELFDSATLAVCHDNFISVYVIECLIGNVLVQRTQLFNQFIDPFQNVRLEIT